MASWTFVGAVLLRRQEPAVLAVVFSKPIPPAHVPEPLSDDHGQEELQEMAKPSIQEPQAPPPAPPPPSDLSWLSPSLDAANMAIIQRALRECAHRAAMISTMNATYLAR